MVTAAIALIVADMSKAPSPVISPEMTRNGKAMRMDKWRRLCCSLIRHENTSRCNRKEVGHFSTLQVSRLTQNHLKSRLLQHWEDLLDRLWIFSVSGSYLGNQRFSYNQELSFKLRVSDNSAMESQDDIIIEAGGDKPTRIALSVTSQNNSLPSTEVRYSVSEQVLVKPYWNF